MPNYIAKDGLIYFPEFCHLMLGRIRDEPEDQEDLIKRRRLECTAHATTLGVVPPIFDAVAPPVAMAVEEPSEQPISAALKGELENCIELHEMELPVTWPPGHNILTARQAVRIKR